jgi:hypothetical protein
MIKMKPAVRVLDVTSGTKEIAQRHFRTGKVFSVFDKPMQNSRYVSLNIHNDFGRQSRVTLFKIKVGSDKSFSLQNGGQRPVFNFAHS